LDTNVLKGNWLIGLGGSKVGGQSGPAALFAPQPGSSYEIQPINQYFVTFGSYTKSKLIDVARISTTNVLVDFTNGPDQVTIRHSPDGNLTIQA
jgi:hypothetical protein